MVPPLNMLPPRQLRFARPSHVPYSLGRAEACCREHLSHLDDRQLLYQTVYVGLREEPAEQVRHEG